jgi:hypothetical protein
MSNRGTIVLVALLALLAPSPGTAQPRAYRGPHPIDLDGRWHLESSTHVHDELATGLEPFGDVDGVLVFLADPLAYGYTGEVWTYRGAHPLPGGLDAYCGIAGEHRHAFAPEGSFRREASGAYAFTGALRGGRRMVRPGIVAPRHPIVVAPGPAPVTPVIGGTFFQLGCVHTWVAAADGSPIAVPLPGCVPHAVPPRPAPPPPAPSPSVERPYTSTFSGPATIPRRVDGAPQRPRPSTPGRRDR